MEKYTHDVKHNRVHSAVMLYRNARLFSPRKLASQNSSPLLDFVETTMVPLFPQYMLHNFPLCPMTHHFLLGILLAFTLVLSGREERMRGGREGGKKEREKERDHSDADQYRLTALHPYWFCRVTQEGTLYYVETSLIIQSSPEDHNGMPMPLLTTAEAVPPPIPDASYRTTVLLLGHGPAESLGKCLVNSTAARTAAPAVKPITGLH